MGWGIGEMVQEEWILKALLMNKRNGFSKALLIHNVLGLLGGRLAWQ